jgi:DNA-binding XRE family transcriptional regulator
VSVPREELAERLRSRRSEIEQALLARIAAVPGVDPVEDLEYREGFRSIIPAAFDFSLAAIGSQRGDVPPVPVEVLSHARLAARHQVGLDTVLRGYVAGSTLIDDFILDESVGADIQPLLRSRANALEVLLARVSDEYESERRLRHRTPETRTFERVSKMLRGEPRSDTPLNYDLSCHHIGIVASGSGSKKAITEFSKAIDCQLLSVAIDSERVWAWLGRRNAIHVDEVTDAIASSKGHQIAVGIGEPASGIAGWRLSHHQARAAMAVAAKSATRLARYADVCLIASAMQDTLLTTSLREMYLQPLFTGKDEGAIHFQTLRAYFAADRNCVAAAAALGVSRQTINNRLRAIEGRLGRTLPSAAAAIELALHVDALRPRN